MISMGLGWYPLLRAVVSDRWDMGVAASCSRYRSNTGSTQTCCAGATEWKIFVKLTLFSPSVLNCTLAGHWCIIYYFSCSTVISDYIPKPSRGSARNVMLAATLLAMLGLLKVCACYIPYILLGISVLGMVDWREDQSKKAEGYMLTILICLFALYNFSLAQILLPRRLRPIQSLMCLRSTV